MKNDQIVTITPNFFNSSTLFLAFLSFTSLLLVMVMILRFIMPSLQHITSSRISSVNWLQDKFNVAEP